MRLHVVAEHQEQRHQCVDKRVTKRILQRATTAAQARMSVVGTSTGRHCIMHRRMPVTASMRGSCRRLKDRLASFRHGEHPAGHVNKQAPYSKV